MAANPSAVEALLRPRSAAVIGMSSKAQSAGHVVLGNLVENDFAGDIHLVGRSGGRIGERTVLESVDQLPEGVDVAILTLPAASVEETIAACGRRKVKAAVVFAAGFAEMGDRSPEERLIATARAGGVAILGPNCLGYVNYIDGLQFNFTRAAKVPKATIDRLNAEIHKTMATDDLKKRFAEFGAVAAPTTPEGFNAIVKSEIAKWSKVIREANIKAE